LRRFAPPTGILPEMVTGGKACDRLDKYELLTAFTQTDQLLFSQFLADTNTNRALTEEQFTKAD
jgi:hypothetical protein